MSINVRMVVKRRHYSLEFRRELVRLFETGKFSVSQLEKLCSVGDSNIYRWIYKYSTFNQQGSRIVEMKQSSTSKLKELEEKVKKLERLVGQKQIKIDFLEEMIAVAKEELNIDIKKKSSTPQSNASGKTKRG
jgi:transposase